MVEDGAGSSLLVDTGNRFREVREGAGSPEMGEIVGRGVDEDRYCLAREILVPRSSRNVYCSD